MIVPEHDSARVRERDSASEQKCESDRASKSKIRSKSERVRRTSEITKLMYVHVSFCSRGESIQTFFRKSGNSTSKVLSKQIDFIFRFHCN